MNMSENVSAKLFVGVQNHGEVKSLLNHSPQWKEAKLFQNHPLIEIHFQEKEYVGFFVSPPLSYVDLKEKEKDLKNQLIYYCPKLQVEKQKIYLFSQLFLS